MQNNKNPNGISSEGQIDNLIDIDRLTKTFELPGRDYTALRNISLRIGKGQFFAIIGKSGSGKSTLLNIITGIDKPTAGYLTVAGVDIQKMDEDALAVWRGKNIGIVFQFFQLLPTLTVLENILLPMDFCNVIPGSERETRARSLLEMVGILNQANKLPSMLSGGEQQRAAIARALANDPPVLVADEPTGNLDSQTSESIFELFAQLVQAGKTVVIVTHERQITRWASETITLSDGRIVEN